MAPDSELLAAWRGGDELAGRRLIQRHYESILSFFCARLSPTEAADLTQGTFEVLCSKRDAFAERSSLRTFLFGIARWKLADHRRRYPNRVGKVVELEGSDSLDADTTLSSRLFARRRENLLVQALRAIPLDDQILLELKEYEGMTAAELAEVFAVPAGTIASRLRRARQRLATAMERLGQNPQDVAETATNLEAHLARIRRHFLDRARGLQS